MWILHNTVFNTASTTVNMGLCCCLVFDIIVKTTVSNHTLQVKVNPCGRWIFLLVMLIWCNVFVYDASRCVSLGISSGTTRYCWDVIQGIMASDWCSWEGCIVPWGAMTRTSPWSIDVQPWRQPYNIHCVPLLQCCSPYSDLNVCINLHIFFHRLMSIRKKHHEQNKKQAGFKAF